MSIDYGMGKVNIDTVTGIRYGVIPSTEINGDGWEDIYSNGDDIGYMQFIEDVKADLSKAINSVLEDYRSYRQDTDKFAEEIVDSIDFDYEPNGCARYAYNCDGYEFETTSDGDIFVTKSPYYTLCEFCSPCAPGAGYLLNSGLVKAYCLGHEWFEGGVAPYEVFKV